MFRLTAKETLQIQNVLMNPLKHYVILIDHNAKVIICSHRGRPKGTVKPELSLAPTIPYLSKVLGQQVQMATDVVGESAKALCSNLQEGQVMMLENVRFEKRRRSKRPCLCQRIGFFGRYLCK